MLRLLSKRYKDGKSRPDFRTGIFGLNLIDSNFWGDGSEEALNVTSDTSLASTLDGDVVVKQLTSLTIDAGKTLTVANRCKGLLIYVNGDCVINGILSMTARGANVNPTSAGVSSTGIRLIRKKTGSTETLSASDAAGCGAAMIGSEAKQDGIAGNGKIYTIQRTGAAGASAKTAIGNGTAGTAGGTLQSGGGGSGGVDYSGPSGAGAAGSCFSGGSGGGGTGYTSTVTAGTANGGAGGNSAWTASNYNSGSGAGNPGGSTTTSIGEAGLSGTGGLLMLFVRGNLTIGSTGSIESKGVRGGRWNQTYVCGGGGGASGGGIAIILYGGSLSNNGSISCAGGVPYSQGNVGHGYSTDGGAGGAGNYIIEQIAI